ncbi:nucleotidyltransferase domain-containing protein [Orenia marismortui]|nr:nucleotidyltransferase domain-containing protein [Orenia marismortui]
MKKDYSAKLKNLKQRRVDPEFLYKEAASYYNEEHLSESYEKINEKDIYKYIIGAMKEVDDIYTRNTYKEGDRIKNQLDKIKSYKLDFEYRYQGSVTNNTHIKTHSDIDLLVIIKKFTTLEPPQKATIPYTGDPVEDLVNLREECYLHLHNAFPEVNVDNTGSKSIALSGGSLKRKVDVVPSNWFDTLKYVETYNECYRGIQILDYFKRERILNTPFYHNKLLEEKDYSCNNNYKKVIRLLKNLKADSNIDIQFSSYDITALMYHMNNSHYRINRSVLVLLKNTKEFLKYILDNERYRNTLYVPDESRKIFDKPEGKLKGLKDLKLEVDTIYEDVIEELGNEGLFLENKYFRNVG